MATLKIYIKSIVSPNNFSLSYKKGNNVGNLNSGFTPYGILPTGTTYSGGTTEIIVSGLSLIYGEQYWIKIDDLVNRSFIVENIIIHEEDYFNSICVPVVTATPTVTNTPGASPTTTPTITSSPIVGTPNPTSTPTLTPTETPSPGTTPTMTVTPTVTETPTLTSTPVPTSTPAPTSTPLPILIGFNQTTGLLNLNDLGDNIINITISGTATASQSWINCDSPPASYADLSYLVGSSYIAATANESRATSSFKDPSTSNSDVYTFTGVTSGTTSSIVINVADEFTYCGDAWGQGSVIITNITKISGSGTVLINQNKKTFSSQSNLSN